MNELLPHPMAGAGGAGIPSRGAVVRGAIRGAGGGLRAALLRAFRRRPSRAVAVVAPEATDARAWIERLFTVETNGHQLLLSAPPTEEVVPGLAPVDAFEALHLCGRSHRRERAWLLWPAAYPTEQSAPPVSLSEFDTAVVLWPAGATVADLAPRRARLMGMLGPALRRGRLRRVAIVISDLAGDRAPQHACQCVIDTRPGEGVLDRLRTELRNSRPRPGDPLADPRWRTTLATLVLEDAGLPRFAENLHVAAGRAFPLFFSATDSTVGLERLVEWLHDGRSEEVPSERVGPRHLRRLVYLAAAAFGALGFVTMIGARTPAPAAGAPLASLRQAVQARAAFAATLSRLPAAGTLGAPELRASARLLSVRERALRDSTMLDSLVARALAGADTLDTTARHRSADTLALAADSLAAGFGPDSVARSAAAFPWRLARSRALLVRALLKLEPREDGAAGFTLAAGERRVLSEGLGRIGLSGLDTRFEQLLAEPEALGFYTRCVAHRSARDPGLRRAFAALGPAVPRVRVPAPDPLDPGSFTGLDARWVRLRTQLDPTAFEEFVRSTPPALARLDAFAALSRSEPRGLAVEFVSPGDRSWHLDVAGGGLPGYQPAMWAGTREGCRVFLPRAGVGTVLTLVLNAGAAVHTADGSLRSPCSGGAQQTLRLDSPSGFVSFAGGARVIEYRVDHWPGPSPASGGRQP